MGSGPGRQLTAVNHSPAAVSDLDTERHTEDILDGIGEAFFGLDRAWRIVYFNRACEDFFGRNRDQVVGRVVWEVYPEVLGSEFEHRYRRAMEERLPVEFQTGSAVRRGRWLDVRAFPTRQGLGIAFRDISERHRAEEELRYQLDVTRTITDNSAEAMFLMDSQGRVSFMNPAAERMFGFSADEMMGHVLHDMLHHHHPDGRPFALSECPLGAVFLTGGMGIPLHDDVFFRKDGSAVDVSCSNMPIYKEGGIVGAALVVRDVTERNRREAALRESEARFRHMADSAPALIWMTDAQGQITFANMHHDFMFGRPAAEIHGDGWYQVLHPEDRAPFEAAFTNAFRERRPFRTEVRVTDRNEQIRWLRCEGVARLDDSGAFLGYTGCNVDITDAKLAGERQRLLINELNHRVKNTLATVQSIAAQTLRNAGSPDQAQEDLEARLFALSRAHDVLTREKWEGANLRSIVASAVEPYGHRGDKRFSVGGPDLRLSPRMSLALSMAFQELITNAIKYGALCNEEGTVDISWTVAPGKEGSRLVLQWRESGGPPVKAPARRGFGSRLIERSLAQDLDGEVTIAFAPTGVVCTVDAPLETEPGAG
jgi:PAS domain S-box-containing protein